MRGRLAGVLEAGAGGGWERLGPAGGGTEELNTGGGLLRAEELTAFTGWGKGGPGVSRRAIPFLMVAGAGGGNLGVTAVIWAETSGVCEG